MKKYIFSIHFDTEEEQGVELVPIITKNRYFFVKI